MYEKFPYDLALFAREPFNDQWKHILPSIFYQHKGEQMYFNWNSSSCKTWTLLFYIVDAMTDDVLTIPGVVVYITTILTYFPWNDILQSQSQLPLSLSGIRNQEFFIWTNNNKLQITVSYRKESAFLWVRNRDKPIIRNISTSKYTCWMSLENQLRHLAAVMDFPSLGRHILIKFCWALYMMKMMSWEISKYEQTNNDNNNHNNNNDYNNQR